MYPILARFIQHIQTNVVLTAQRVEVLQPLIDGIRLQYGNQQPIQLNFICTHNSRRSILAQVWGQLAADYFGFSKVNCFSGGTQQTTIAPQIIHTLSNQGLSISELAVTDNPIYAIKQAANALPIIGFSKKYDSAFNPSTSFIAVLTCSEADGDCPFIAGATLRIPISYEDPKIADGTAEEVAVYAERSRQVAREMFYVFSQIKK